MRAKIHSECQEINTDNKPKELLFENIKKNIDEKIAYNKSLANQLIIGDQKKALKVVISEYIQLPENPNFIKLADKETLELIHKKGLENIISVLQDYIKIKTTADKASFDHLYLHLYFVHHEWLTPAQSLSQDALKSALSYLYKGKELTNKVNQIVKDLNAKSSKIPLMREINDLAKMRATLSSKISPFCIQFMKDVQLKCFDGSTTVSLGKEAQIRNFNIMDEAFKFLDKNYNEELEKLIRKSLASRTALLKNSESGTLALKYLDLFDKKNSWDQVNNEINNLLSKLKLERQELDPKENLILEKKSQAEQDENQINSESESSSDLADISDPSIASSEIEILQDEIITNTNSGTEEQESSPLSISSCEINSNESLSTIKVEMVAKPNHEEANSKITQEKTQQPKTLEISYKESNTFPTISRFFGRIGEKYARFIGALSSNKYNMADLNTLGNIEYNSKEHYFKRSSKSINLVKEFFGEFFSDEYNVQAAICSHRNKYKEKVNPNNPTAMFASCISFISITKNSKEYCLISTSLDEHLSFFSLLKNFVDNYNRSGANTVEFVLLGGKIGYFNEIFRAILGESYLNKPCAEKFFIKALTKLFLENGRSLRINDVSTVRLYPFKKHATYGDRHSDTLDVTVRPPMPDEIPIQVSDENYLVLAGNCITCQNNTTAVYKILKLAQEMGEETKQKKAPRLELSPLRHSIKTQSSLLFTNNLGNEAEEISNVYSLRGRK